MSEPSEGVEDLDETAALTHRAAPVEVVQREVSLGTLLLCASHWASLWCGTRAIIGQPTVPGRRGPRAIAATNARPRQSRRLASRVLAAAAWRLQQAYFVCSASSLNALPLPLRRRQLSTSQ